MKKAMTSCSSPPARALLSRSCPAWAWSRLFTLRTVEDTLRIREFMDRERPKSVVLAGGGFIGLELAENLRELGMDVTIVAAAQAADESL